MKIFTEDHTFTQTAKNIVSMLWNHLGYTNIKSKKHPMHHFETVITIPFSLV